MAEQWRAMVALDNELSAELPGLLRCKQDLAREMRDRTGGAAVVVGAPSSRLNAWLLAWHARQSPVCAYTDNRAAAESAAQAAREVLVQHGLAAPVSVECWRPVKKQWVDASDVSAGGLAEERHYQQREDRRRSAETGRARWRVRVELRSHRDTVA